MKDKKYSPPPTELCCSPPPQTVSPTPVIHIFTLSFLWTGWSPLAQKSFKAVVEPGYFCSSRWPLLQAGKVRCRNCSHSQSRAQAGCVHTACAHTCVCVCVHVCAHSVALELFIHQLPRQGLRPVSSLPGPFSRCPQHPGGAPAWEGRAVSQPSSPFYLS